MKKFLALILCALLALSFTACSSGGLEIAVPNDTTNEARALLLLEANGIIKLKEGAGITATIMDIAENPKNIKFKEVEAAQIPNILKDVDYAVINSNYAIEAGLDPMTQSLTIEGSYSAYANIVAVKEGNENTPKIKALVAALSSQKVADFITATYKGAVVSTVDAPTDGFDASVDYAALAGQTITVAASPAPHAEILAVAKEILAEKNVTLEVIEFTDYVQPNNVVESGEIDANYFQHTPYLDDFNAQNGTHIVSAAAIHVEPMSLYGGKQSSLDALK
jgi:D-methionine transport system substrate-binding protein